MTEKTIESGERIRRCPCGWSGTQPSVSDASHEVIVDGELVVDRQHLCVCPRCFTPIGNAVACPGFA